MGQETVAPAYSITGLEVAKLESKDFYNLPEAPYRRKKPVTTSNIITTQELDKSPYFSDVYIPHTKMCISGRGRECVTVYNAGIRSNLRLVMITPVEEVPSVRRREEQAAPAAPSPPPVEGFEQREWEPTSRLSLLSEAASTCGGESVRGVAVETDCGHSTRASYPSTMTALLNQYGLEEEKKKADQTVGASENGSEPKAETPVREGGAQTRLSTTSRISAGVLDSYQN